MWSLQFLLVHASGTVTPCMHRTVILTHCPQEPFMDYLPQETTRSPHGSSLQETKAGFQLQQSWCFWAEPPWVKWLQPLSHPLISADTCKAGSEPSFEQGSVSAQHHSPSLQGPAPGSIAVPLGHRLPWARAGFLWKPVFSDGCNYQSFPRLNNGHFYQQKVNKGSLGRMHYFLLSVELIKLLTQWDTISLNLSKCSNALLERERERGVSDVLTDPALNEN